METIPDTLAKPDGADQPQNTPLRLVTNMRFHESAIWCAAATSIYPDHGRQQPERGAAWEAWRLWRAAGSGDAVLTLGDRTTLLYGLLCRLTGRASHQIACELFFDEIAPRHLPGRLKRGLYRWALAGSRGLLTNSRAEGSSQAAYLGLPPDRVHFVPLNANPVPTHPAPADEGFLVAAGRSGRDYPTLLRALDGTGLAAHLFVGAADLPAVVPPTHVVLHREAPRAEYLDHLRRCALAVVPLRPTQRATGQVVLLEAMALGKAVIATRAPGTEDYVRDGETGLLVEPGDAAALRRALTTLMAEPERRHALGEAAARTVSTHHSVEIHARAKLAAIRALIPTSAPLTRLPPP